MMGQRTGGQKPLFYSFKLDDHVPADHLLRGIDRCLDLGELRHHLAPFYSHTGQPSIDPELILRMLIVGYVQASENLENPHSLADSRPVAQTYLV
jgi:transposase